MKNNIGIYFIAAVCNGNLYKDKSAKNYYLRFRQSEENIDLLEKLAIVFKSDGFNSRVHSDKHIKCINGPCHAYFTKLRGIVAKSIIPNVTTEMLAIHIMSHGSRSKHGMQVYMAAKNRDLHLKLIARYRQKFGLTITLWSSAFYIGKNSIKQLEDLIRPHLTPSYRRKFGI